MSTAQAVETTPAPIPLDQRFALQLDEVAERIGVSTRTLERQLVAGEFPKPDRRVGRTRLWKPETIRRWMDGGGDR